MTSRHLYFKLLWEDIKRKLWAAALLGLAFFFVLPVAMAMVLPSYEPNEYVTMAAVIERRIRNVKSMLDFGDSYPMVLIVFFIAALVMGISTFSYLHNKKQIDFYHSLPVKRNLWFAVHISTGILIPAAVYLAAAAVSLVVARVNGVAVIYSLPAAVHGYLCHMLYYGLIYITVVLAMMMTGTRLAAVLGTAVFFLYCPAFGGLMEAFHEVFFDTYYYSAPSVWKMAVVRISPLYGLVSAVSNGVTLGHVAWAAGAILLLGLLSFFLYLKRPSEAAGKTMAFGRSKGMIKVLIVVASGLAGGLFFYSIRETLVWMVFGVIVGVVISHCVIEVLYHSDFKKLFCHEKTMAACMTAGLLISFSFYFDVFRYDTYVPSGGQVAYSSIDFGEDGWVSYFDGMYPDGGIKAGNVLTRGRISNTEAVIGIAAEGVRQLPERNTAEEKYNQWCTVVVCYTMKSGRKVYRQYNMFLDPVMELADQIYTDPEYKKALYPGLELDAREAAGNTAYQEGVTEKVFLLSGDEEKQKAVIEAYQQELGGLSISARERECPVGELLLISDKEDGLIQERHGKERVNSSFYRKSYWYDGYFYPVYPSFTKTIEALSECGVAAGASLAPENFKAVQLIAYGPFEEEDNEESEENEETWQDEYGNEWTEPAERQAEEIEPYSIIYSEPEKIRELVAGFSINRDYKNNMLLRSDYQVFLIPKEIEVTPDWEKDSGQTINGSLIYGKVPEFVIEDFRKMEAEKKKK